MHNGIKKQNHLFTFSAGVCIQIINNLKLYDKPKTIMCNYIVMNPL